MYADNISIIIVEDDMDIDSVGRISDTVISPVSPTPEESPEEQETLPAGVVEDPGKILDLYA